MKIHEYQGKEIFRRYGIAVPKGEPAFRVEEVGPIAERLIAETGIPVVLDTSFNENEPIVNTPDQAIDCFLRTKRDVIVLGDLFVERMGR